MKPYFIIISSLVVFSAQAQKLLVKDCRNNALKKIKIGKVMSVTTEDPFNYSDSIGSKRNDYYCQDGCLRLLSIDVKNRSFKIGNESKTFVQEFKVDEVNTIQYVRAKHPYQVQGMKVMLCIYGAALLINAAFGHYDADAETIFLASGATLVGYGLLNHSNVARTYQIIGIEE